MKTYLKCGIALITVGVVLGGAALIKSDFKLSNIKVEKNLVDKNYESEGAVTSISYSGKAEDLRIVYSDTVSTATVKYNESDIRTYDVSVNEGDLTVKQHMKKNYFVKAMTFSKYKAVMTITVPTSLANLNVSLDAGQVTISDLTVDTSTVNLDAGEIDINNSVFKNLTTSVDAGEINAKNVNTNKVDMSMDAGEIDYSGVVLEDGKFDCNVGEINITLEQMESEISVNNVVDGKINIKVSVDIGDKNVTFIKHDVTPINN